MSARITPPKVVEPFGKDAVPPYINAVIPVTDPGDGAASYSLGFPPATMTDPSAGGIPPSGADMNGVLYAATAFCQMLQAGQFVSFDADVSTAQTGYHKGAILFVPSTGALDPGSFYQSTANGNTNDPASVVTNWRKLNGALYAASSPSAGAHNDVALAGPSDYVLDYNTAAGNASFSGFVAQVDGQRLTITNTGANLLTLVALATSSAANQLRLPTDLALVQNQSASFVYSAGAGKWLLA